MPFRPRRFLVPATLLALLGALLIGTGAASAHSAAIRCVAAPKYQPPTPPQSPLPATASAASGPRVCPAGKTPEAVASSVRPHSNDKGIPVVNQAGGISRKDNPGYHYVSYYDNPSPPVPGTFADITVAAPALDTRDSHTLAEIAAQSADGKQIVEIGWTVDRGINGGSVAPHLFTFSWINGVGQGYNAANPYYHAFTGGGSANPNFYTTGMVLPTSSTPRRFVIWHYAGNWDLGIAVPGTTHIDYIGYFPDSEWGGGYTSMGLVQWFGEVNDSNNGLDCTQMGNGAFGTFSGGATVGQPALIQDDSGTSVFASPSLIVTDPSDYNGLLSTGGFGGPGPCVTAPPHTDITQHPAATIKTHKHHANVTFSFISGSSNFQCKLDGGGFSACSSPRSYTVATGSHTFSVHATDTYGQVGPDATFSFKVVHKHHKRS